MTNSFQNFMQHLQDQLINDQSIYFKAEDHQVVEKFALIIPESKSKFKRVR